MAPPELVLIGERDLAKRAHVGIETSLALFKHEVDPALSFRWISTAEVAAETPERVMSSATGIWCTPGSPYENTAGALQAVRFAREQRRAFLGTCGGFQHALMEYYQNVLGRRATHAETDFGATDPLIVKLSCSLVGVRSKVIAIPHSAFADWLGGAESIEEFNCNYGLASSVEPAFSGSEIKFVAYDKMNQVRAFHLTNHPFFVGTLFQPERRALAGTLHPLIKCFLQHAAQYDRG